MDTDLNSMRQSLEEKFDYLRRLHETFASLAAGDLHSGRREPIPEEEVRFTVDNAYFTDSDELVKKYQHPGNFAKFYAGQGQDTSGHEDFFIMMPGHTALQVINRMFGGDPETVLPDRELTDIEFSMWEIIFDRFGEVLQQMWSGNADIKPRISNAETNIEYCFLEYITEENLILSLFAIDFTLYLDGGQYPLQIVYKIPIIHSLAFSGSEIAPNAERDIPNRKPVNDYSSTIETFDNIARMDCLPERFSHLLDELPAVLAYILRFMPAAAVLDILLMPPEAIRSIIMENMSRRSPHIRPEFSRDLSRVLERKLSVNGPGVAYGGMRTVCTTKRKGDSNEQD